MARVTRVLVPTDFSAPSVLALEYAVDLAQRFGAAIHLLHVLEDPLHTTSYPDGYFVELSRLREEMLTDAERRLREVSEACRAAQVPVTVEVALGRPARVIVQEAANRGSDLIIMGTHGRSGIAHLLLGSVAERVLRLAPCPVLTVRDTTRLADLMHAADAGERDAAETR